jgi:trigger factor
MKLKKKPSNVTEEDMGKALQGMRFRKAQLTVVQDGSVKRGDHIICDCKVEVERSVVLEPFRHI